MSNTTFKIGDRVKIIDSSLIDSCELNRIGTVVMIDRYNPNQIICVVDMGRPRRKGGSGESCWWLKDDSIELVSKPNKQLLFDFMYK